MSMNESSFVDAGVLFCTCEHCSFQTEMPLSCGHVNHVHVFLQFLHGQDFP